MYVCICNGYREAQIREVARQGVTAAADAYQALGQGPCCGRCIPFAQRILDDSRKDGDMLCVTE